MSEEKFLLKNIINSKSVDVICQSIKSFHPDFDDNSFKNDVLKTLDTLELKQRINHITENLINYLPQDFTLAIDILNNALGKELPEKDVLGDANYEIFYYASFGEYVVRKGLDNFNESLNALYLQTKRFTSENSIRTFIINHYNQTMAILEKWTEDTSIHVRRLVSEGTRPRLPWAQKLDMFIKDPQPVINLLEKLKKDESTYVRRSVANNLNDISKDNPELVIETLKKWQDGTKEMDWITKQALRTLIKKGYQAALDLIGFDDSKNLHIENFSLSTEKLAFGDSLKFNFDLISSKPKESNVIIDYIIQYKKANGSHSPKVYKFKSIKIQEKERINLSAKRPFLPITTRKFYPGIHKIEIMVNGKILASRDFELVM